jgi:hypothetical protein
MGFAQQCYPVGPVQNCVFGDEGAGKDSPTSLMEKLCRLGLSVLSVQSKDGARAVRMVADEVFCGLPTMGADRGGPRLRV